MFNLNSSSTPIGAWYRITFFALFFIVVGSQHISAQSQLAQDAYAIFEQNCLNCHGPDGAYRDVLLMEYDLLNRRGYGYSRQPRWLRFVQAPAWSH